MTTNRNSRADAHVSQRYSWTTTGMKRDPDGSFVLASDACARNSRADALTDRIKAMFVPNPADELGPTDEPESQYRFGYNTALEDVLSAIAASPAEPPAAAPADERAAFEAWYERTCPISAEALRTGACDESIQESRDEMALGFSAGVAYARAAASPAVSIPDGYALVPKRITTKMIESAMEHHYGKRRARQNGGAGGIVMTVNDTDWSGIDAMRRLWKGALAAAPQPAQAVTCGVDTALLARLSAQILGCPLNPSISKFARALLANAQPAQADAREGLKANQRAAVEFALGACAGHRAGEPHVAALESLLAVRHCQPDAEGVNEDAAGAREART
ncbi:hypothetical protein [Burkholderia ubonensis]|uniref:hypothetical protein n=1 Tax=Burkholderia ubonensis TaxID=101571 RepID=UPI0012F84FA5|nr:hypothetical protein [Burkholderia ubonensis]